MRNLGTIVGLAILLAGANPAMAQDALDLKGTWNPTQGAHIVDGDSRHLPSGSAKVPGHDTHRRNTSPFVFRIDGQEGRTFWGTLSSAKIKERLIGALSVDGKRFVMADDDGHFDGFVVDNDTLDYCYHHIEPGHSAVACGLLARQK